MWFGVNSKDLTWFLDKWNKEDDDHLSERREAKIVHTVGHVPLYVLVTLYGFVSVGFQDEEERDEDDELDEGNGDTVFEDTLSLKFVDLVTSVLKLYFLTTDQVP